MKHYVVFCSFHACFLSRKCLEETERLAVEMLEGAGLGAKAGPSSLHRFLSAFSPPPAILLFQPPQVRGFCPSVRWRAEPGSGAVSQAQIGASYRPGDLKDTSQLSCWS